MITPDQQDKAILNLVRKCREMKFFGNLVLHFAGGNFITANTNQSLRAESLVDAGNLSEILGVSDGKAEGVTNQGSQELRS